MIAIIVIVLFLAGLALIITGSCGKLINNHYICSKCGFDLYGIVNCDQDRKHKKCPECGALLDRDYAVVRGKRKRSRPMFFAGFFIWAMLLGSVLLIVVGQTGDINWQQYKPVSWLMKEMGGEDIFEAAAAQSELLDRFSNDRLSDDALIELIDFLLDYQALDHSDNFRLTVEDFILAIKKKGKLPENQWIRFLKQGFAFEPKIRERVSLSEALVFGVKHSARRSVTHPFEYDYEILKVEVGYASANLERRHSFENPVLLSFDDLDLPLKPGVYSVTVHFALSVKEGDTELHAWPVMYKDEVEILDRDSSTVKLVYDPALLDQFKKEFKVTGFRLLTGGFAPYVVTEGDLPLGRRYEVRVYDGDKTWLLGQLIADVNSPFTLSYDAEVPKAFDVEAVDISLWPITDKAYRGYDVYEVLDLPVIYKNVPVTHE